MKFRLSGACVVVVAAIMIYVVARPKGSPELLQLQIDRAQERQLVLRNGFAIRNASLTHRVTRDEIPFVAGPEQLPQTLAATLPPIEGFWISTDSTNGIAAVAILRSDADSFVEVWGACQPTDCHWPPRPLRVVEPSTELGQAGQLKATLDGPVERSAIFRHDGQALLVEVAARYRDDSGRKDNHITERFTRPFAPTSNAGLPTLPPVGSVVRDKYQREFGERVPIPAIFNDERSVDCSRNGHLTTTAYIRRPGNRSTLLEMYLSHDGTVVTAKRVSTVITPAGTFKTLVVIVRYGATVSADGIELFEKAQKQINEDHAAFARGRGYAAPLVVFENTNIVVPREAIGDPRRLTDVRAAAASRGVSPTGYQLVIAIDPDPAHFAGGLSTPPNGDVYVGNFGHWTSELAQPEWTAMARVAYHHEVAHQWGWDHDWSPSCGETKLGFEPFMAAPVLLGWEDIDGDGLPEIVDDTPYGVRR